MSAKDYPLRVSLYAVEAVEVNPPAGQEPIHWRLLTTHEVVCVEQALQVIEWYRWRWRIDQMFATLKQAGLNLEATQLESVEAIKRLTVLALSVALRTLQLVEGRDNSTLTAAVAFSDEQQQCLAQLAPTLQGHTSITAKSSSCRFFSLGDLADCSSRWLVGLPFAASSWDAHTGAWTAAV